MSTTISGDVTATSATPRHALGSIFVEHSQAVGVDGTGPRTWIYVQTEDALVQGNVCQRKNGTATRVVVLSAADQIAQAIVGVAQHAIADNYYGWILRQGIGEVLAGTESIDVNEGIAASSTSGAAQELGNTAADTNVDSYRAFGYATEDAAAAALATCYVDCRG